TFGADCDVGEAAIASVVDEHAVAGIGDVLRQGFDVVERAAAAGRERDPGAAGAEDFVIDIYSAHMGDGHRFPPRFRSLPSLYRQSLPRLGRSSRAVRAALA